MAKFHKTKDREEAYRNAINLWLSSKPFPGEASNISVCKGIIEQNKERRKNLRNVSGTMLGEDLRLGVSLPPGLYYVLSNIERQHGREFLKDKSDLRWFARRFPQFCIYERI